MVRKSVFSQRPYIIAVVCSIFVDHFWVSDKLTSQLGGLPPCRPRPSVFASLSATRFILLLCRSSCLVIFFDVTNDPFSCVRTPHFLDPPSPLLYAPPLVFVARQRKFASFCPKSTTKTGDAGGAGWGKKISAQKRLRFFLRYQLAVAYVGVDNKKKFHRHGDLLLSSEPPSAPSPPSGSSQIIDLSPFSQMQQI